ncbi:MAG: hypothetical protein M1G31_22425 [Pseudanabaena sp. Salubria-1]|nr:hypothetical protein [Pseudanabaena sp. Salubria-1]
MKYGLIERNFICINEALQEYLEIGEVILFDSRTNRRFQSMDILGDRFLIKIWGDRCWVLFVWRSLV